MLAFLPLWVLFISTAVSELRPWLKTLLGPPEIPKEKLSAWSKVYQEHIQGHYKSYVNLLAERIDREYPHAYPLAQEEAVQQGRKQLRELMKAMLKKSPKGRRVKSNPTNEDQDISDEEVDYLLSEDATPKKKSTGRAKVSQKDINVQVELYANLLASTIHQDAMAEQIIRGRQYASEHAKQEARGLSRQKFIKILKGVVKDCQGARRVWSDFKETDPETSDQDIDLSCEDAEAKETLEEDIRKKNGSPRFNLGSAAARADETLKSVGSALNAVKHAKPVPGGPNTGPVRGFTGLAGFPRAGPVLIQR